jgi:hypothetical protein
LLPQFGTGWLNWHIPLERAAGTSSDAGKVKLLVQAVRGLVSASP